MSIIVCGGTVHYRRCIRPCWGSCEGARRRVVLAYDHSPYYDAIATCCHCGDRWSDGELWPRPFMRGWRAKSVASARQHWGQGTAGPPARDEDGYLLLAGAS